MQTRATREGGSFGLGHYCDRKIYTCELISVLLQNNISNLIPDTDQQLIYCLYWLAKITGLDNKLHIVLADDDEDDRLFFRDALDELQIAVHVTTVNDGEELLMHRESALPDTPQALFLDLNMPRKNGFESLHEIKKHLSFQQIPVIIISTSFDKEKANLLFNNGAHYYICKPSDFEQLKHLLKRTIGLIQQNLKAVKENFLIV